jgi:competence protein ComEA
VRLPPRRPDDADVIRARLRALLDDPGGPGGWVPADPADDIADELPDGSAEIDLPVDDLPDDERAVPPGLGRHRAPGSAVRLSPGAPGARSLWLAALCAGIVLVAWTWWDRPVVAPVVDRAAASSSVPAPASPTGPSVGEMANTSAALVVSVVGLVAHPGLVTLPPGSRVADAVEAAGGLLPEADPAMVNLAALVSDGQQIAVGVTGAAPESAGGQGSVGGKVDLNTATVADLDALPGIGPVLAQRIVDHRAAQGPFRSVDDLDDVPGIGPAIFGELADLVVVSR